MYWLTFMVKTHKKNHKSVFTPPQNTIVIDVQGAFSLTWIVCCFCGNKNTFLNKKSLMLTNAAFAVFDEYVKNSNSIYNYFILIYIIYFIYLFMWWLSHTILQKSF